MLKVKLKTTEQMQAGISVTELGEPFEHASANRYASVIKKYDVAVASVSVVKLLLEYGAEPDVETVLSAHNIASGLRVKPAIKDLIYNT